MTRAAGDLRRRGIARARDRVVRLAHDREARTEVRKVIWPTRQETLHTTLIVAAVTAVMSLILWGLDGILVRLVSFITGLRF